MNSIFVANAHTIGQFEEKSERHGGAEETLAEYAEPQLISMTLNADERWLKSLRHTVEEDLCYELDRRDDAVLVFTWSEEEVRTTKGPNVKRVWVHTCRHGDEEVAKLVIEEWEGE